MTTLEDVLENQRKYNILTSPTIKPANRETVSPAATDSTLFLYLQNKTTASTAYAFVTGLALPDNKLFLLQSDGSTVYYPSQPANDGTPLPVDCAINLGGPGNGRLAVVPRMVGGRIWLVEGSKLNFFLNRAGAGAALVEPSASTTGDTNYYYKWSFAELTFNDLQAFANITYVDFVGPPVSLGLVSNESPSQLVPGLPTGGLSTVCRELEAQNSRDGAGWNRLVVKGRSGEDLRAISPIKAISHDDQLFRNYWQPYVDAVWSKYSSQDLNLNTQVQWGMVKGRVQDGKLTFGNVGAIPQPSARDIFFCDTGAFSAYPNNTAQMGNIVARLSAAFNRSTLLMNANQPDGEQVSNYYKHTITNHYARIVHAAHPDGKGYAFPYDDVAPNDASNVAGTVASSDPNTLIVAFGGQADIQAAKTAVMAKTGRMGERDGDVLRERVPGWDVGRMGGRAGQLIGFGRRGGGAGAGMPRRLMRRALEVEEEMSEVGIALGDDPTSSTIVVERDQRADDEMDVEKGMLHKLEDETAWGAMPQHTRRHQIQGQGETQIERLVPLALRNKINALLEKMSESSPAFDRHARPMLETMGRLLVAVLSLSVRTIVSRAVMVLLLVGCSFLLGFFGNGGAHGRLSGAGVGAGSNGDAGLVPAVNVSEGVAATAAAATAAATAGLGDRVSQAATVMRTQRGHEEEEGVVMGDKAPVVQVDVLE